MTKVLHCPVCDGALVRDLLRLASHPIYHHPVEATQQVPEPHVTDLVYRQCLGCGHAFQADYDLDLLARIYSSFYFTPAVEGVAEEDRKDFLAYLATDGALQLAHLRKVLEVGCSSGEMLREVAAYYLLDEKHLVGVEPNAETAQAARKKGITVHQAFFDDQLADELGVFDLVLCRNVIEHVPEPVGFMKALTKTLATPTSRLVIETPSLDWALSRGDHRGFHFEHLHMFSLHSLATAARRAGLSLLNATRKSLGNLIATFGLGRESIALTQTDTTVDFQQVIDRRIHWWRQRMEGRPVIFWGAGSAARLLMAETGVMPEAIGDANPGKVGKKFVGLPYAIAYAPTMLTQYRRSEKRYLLVGASMFDAEIRRSAAELGWQGDYIGLSDYPGAYHE